MTYFASAQLLSATESSDGRIVIWWNDTESLVFDNNEAFQLYCTSLTSQLDQLLRTLLLMDYSEQKVAGKTASLSISDPDNNWVIVT
jgi:hypothetical protein